VTTQPKALWLAYLLDVDPRSKAHHDEAAAELRRLHSVNAELLGALKAILEAKSDFDEGEAHKIARAAIRAAIARTEEVKPSRIEGYNTNRDQPTFTIKEVKP
jgi:hypothetical protein